MCVGGEGGVRMKQGHLTHLSQCRNIKSEVFSNKRGEKGVAEVLQSRAPDPVVNNILFIVGFSHHTGAQTKSLKLKGRSCHNLGNTRLVVVVVVAFTSHARILGDVQQLIPLPACTFFVLKRRLARTR